MSNKGSDDSNPRGGRRPASRRPVTGSSRRPPPRRRPAARPAPQPEQLDDEDRTQALNLADFAGIEGAPQFVDDDDRTVSVDAAAIRARVAASALGDEGEATVAMQLPEGLLDEDPVGGSKTLVGFPRMSSRTSNAVRGARAAPARETLAMDGKAVRAAIQATAKQRGLAAQRRAPAATDDEGEATVAMNVDDMLSQIDGGAAAPGDDEGEATMAMNVDSMLSQIDDSGPADAGEGEDERTMAVDVNAMLEEIEDGAPVDDGDAARAGNLDDMIGQLDAPPRPAPAAEDPADDGAPDWVAAAAAAAAPAPADGAVGSLGSAPSTEGLFGAMAYALSYDGRRSEIDAGLAAIDEGTADASLRAEYEAARAALDPAAMKQGWIMFGALCGAVTVLFLVLGLLL